jgi:hypothetical protein
MKDTWASRDLLVLDAAVELVDEMYPAGRYPEGNDIAAHAGLDVQSVGAALNALEGEFLELQRTGDLGRWGVPRVTPAARRAVGQWPTAESLIDKLAAGIALAAEHESDPERKGKLMALARGLGSFAGDVAVSVAAQTLGQHVPR